MYTKDLYITATDLNSLVASDWKIVCYKQTLTTDKGILDYKNKVSSVDQDLLEYPNQLIIANTTGDDLEYLIINNTNEENAYDTYIDRSEIVAGNILGFVFLPQNEVLHLYDAGRIRAIALRAVNSLASNLNPLRIDFTDYRSNTITRI